MKHSNILRATLKWCVLLLVFRLCIVNSRSENSTISNQSHGAPVITINGEYDGWTYDKTRAAYREQTYLRVGFVVRIAENGWNIYATNLDNQSSSETLIYDGTNTYLFASYNDHFVKPAPESNAVFVSISPSSIYSPPISDAEQIYIPWMCYCLSPKALKQNNTGKIVIPLPWYIPRLQATAYGYKWNVHYLDDREFIDSCEVVRDTSLDLSDKEELARPEIDYPHTLNDRNNFMGVLGIRRYVTDGYTNADYRCMEWYSTNGLSIPKESNFGFYVFGEKVFKPIYIVKLKTSAITIDYSAETGVNPPSPTVPTFVHDYRYRNANATHRFDFAEYELQSNEEWKSDKDPKLLAQANDYLQHGRKYDDFGPLSSMLFLSNRTKLILAWSLLASVQVLAVITLWCWYNKRKLNKHNQ